MPTPPFEEPLKFTANAASTLKTTMPNEPAAPGQDKGKLKTNATSETHQL